MAHQSKSTRFLSLTGSRRWLVLGLLVLVLLVGGLAFAHYSNPKKSFSTIPSTSPPNSNSSSTSSDNKSTSSPSSSASSDNSSSQPTSEKQTQASAGTSLIKPSGNFVSNHHPASSGDMSQEESVCNTTPGATCYIKFTKGGAVRQLEPKVADSSGTAYWNWNITTANLSQGSWVITAVASLNGQTSTAQDDQDLQVQP